MDMFGPLFQDFHPQYKKKLKKYKFSHQSGMTFKLCKESYKNKSINIGQNNARDKFKLYDKSNVRDHTLILK